MPLPSTTPTLGTPLLFVAGRFQSTPDPGLTKLIEAIRGRSLRILLIDDNPGFRKSMVFLLAQKYGADVIDAASGPEGLALLKTGAEFDVIIIDLMMPAMDGVQTYHEIRRAGIVCRIVLMSAHPESSQWEQAVGLHLELVEKPISEQALISILSEL